MASYETDWKSGHIWKMIDIVAPSPNDPGVEDILIFMGNGTGGTRSKLRSSGKPTSWGSDCTYLTDGTVQVRHNGTWCIVQQSGTSPVRITCSEGSFSFTAREDKETMTNPYNRDWAPTRIWTVESSSFSDLAKDDILIFTGDGNGPGSELKKSSPQKPVISWGLRCKYDSDTVTVGRRGRRGVNFIITRDTAKRPIQLSCDLKSIVTGTTWTAEEGAG
jgi:hypothetical protein